MVNKQLLKEVFTKQNSLHIILKCISFRQTGINKSAEESQSGVANASPLERPAFGPVGRGMIGRQRKVGARPGGE